MYVLPFADSGMALWHYAVVTGLLIYLTLVRMLRYNRMYSMIAPFKDGQRLLSSMTTEESFKIMTQLQSLEFPSALNKARSIALLKAGGIPTMSKLFAVTGNNNARNAGRRAVDTEILLRESQTQPRESERYMTAVARMNFLHERYRKAGKILDEDLLHTLGDGAAEIIRVVNKEEWRQLTEVEQCAIGVFHRNLGEDLGISFAPLGSSQTGWTDGLHFVRELIQWTESYEERVASPTATGDMYVRVYLDSATKKMGPTVTKVLRMIVGNNLNDTMRESLCIEKAGPGLKAFSHSFRLIRKAAIRHLFLPRPSRLSCESVSKEKNSFGLYNFNHAGFQPWYIAPSFLNTWNLRSIILRALGARKPGSHGGRYKPAGYDLMTIGPATHEGKGHEEMLATIEYMKARGADECPFASMKHRNVNTGHNIQS